MESNGKKSLVLIGMLGLLFIGNAYFAFKTFTLQKELVVIKSEVNAFHQNEKIINFAGLFIEKVLKADKEIDFDTRLKLENAVREIKDEEILTQWRKFVESKTEAEAQDEVKNLLEMLIGKI